MEKLMNEENERDHRISAGVKEGPADCIRSNEVAAAECVALRVPSKVLRERPGLDDIGCYSIGMCCEKKTMTG